MKKLISLLLVLAMVCAVAAGCAPETPNETTAGTNETTAAADETTAAADETTGAADETTGAPAASNGASEVLSNVWNLYDEADKFFAIGGDMSAPVDNAPGVYSLEDENLTFQLLIPAEQVANVDEAASLIHAMNTNTFTGSVFHLVDGADVDAFTAAMQEAVQNNQWMCGFPEKLIIAVVDGEYVLTVFGLGDAVNPFETKLAEAYPDAVIAYNEAIAA